MRAHKGEGVAVLGGPWNVPRLSMTAGHFAPLLMRVPGHSRNATFESGCAARGSPRGPRTGRPTASLATPRQFRQCSSDRESYARAKTHPRGRCIRTQLRAHLRPERDQEAPSHPQRTLAERRSSRATASAQPPRGPPGQTLPRQRHPVLLGRPQAVLPGSRSRALVMTAWRSTAQGRVRSGLARGRERRQRLGISICERCEDAGTPAA